MKLKGNITLLIGREETRIEIRDEDANITFLRATLTPEQLSTALARQANVECELEINGIEKIGKKHENKRFKFEINERLASLVNEKTLTDIANSQLKDGWVCSGYFGSQDSFFKKDGKQYARCTIRRWV